MQSRTSALHARGSGGLYLETARLQGEARYTAGNGAREPQLDRRRKRMGALPARTEILGGYSDEQCQSIE